MKEVCEKHDCVLCDQAQKFLDSANAKCANMEKAIEAMRAYVRGEAGYSQVAGVLEAFDTEEKERRDNEQV